MSKDIRKFLAITRGEKPVKETSTKDVSVRDLLKITRNKSLNEAIEEKKTTPVDQAEEERKMNAFFADNNVDIQYQPLNIYDNGVFWGGMIDGQIQFIFKVAKIEEDSGVELNYLEGFTADNPENNEIIKKIDTYYDSFYKYWRDNLFTE